MLLSFRVSHPQTSLILEPSPVVFLWFIPAAAVSTTGPPWSIYITAGISSCHFSAQKSQDGSAAQEGPQHHRACRAFQHLAPPADVSPWSSPSSHVPPWGSHTGYSVQLEYPAYSSPSSSFRGLLRGPLGGGASVPNQPLPSHQHCPSPALSLLLHGVHYLLDSLHPLVCLLSPLRWSFMGSGQVCCISPGPSIACGTLELP